MRTILFVALVCSAFAVQVQEQAAMQSTGPADLLLDHLDKITTDIRTEQFKHQALFEKQDAQCNEEISARTTAIRDGEDALKRSTAHHLRCDSSLQEARANLADAQAKQTQVRGNIQVLTIRREQEKEDFIKLINDELDPAIRAVQGAYPILEEFAAGSVSFVQVTRKMSTTFKSVVKAGYGGSMAGPLTAMVSMSQGFDPAAIEQVRRLFEKLEADLTDSKMLAITQEEQRQTIFETTVAEYESILAKLVATEQELTAYIGEMETCVITESGIIDQATSKISNNKQALGYAVDMCTAFRDEYQNAKRGRDAELELLAKLKEFIQEQAALFGEYGLESSGAFDDYKSQYESGVQGQVAMFIQMRQEKSKEFQEKFEKAIN